MAWGPPPTGRNTRTTRPQAMAQLLSPTTLPANAGQTADASGLSASGYDPLQMAKFLSPGDITGADRMSGVGRSIAKNTGALGDSSIWSGLVRGAKAFVDARNYSRDAADADLERSQKIQQFDWAAQQHARDVQQQQAQQDFLSHIRNPDQRSFAQAYPTIAAQALGNQAFAHPQQAVESGFVWTQNPDGTLVRGDEVPLTAEQRANLGLEGARLAMARDQQAQTMRWRPMSPEELDTYSLPPGTSAMINDATGQVKAIRSARQYSEGAGQAADFANRMVTSDKILTDLEYQHVNPAAVYAFGFGDEKANRYRQAQREFVNAVLRKESGAAIGQSEFQSAAQQYFPVPGDTPAILQQKRAARQAAIEGLKHQSQGAYQEWFGGKQQAPDPNANVVRWGRDAHGNPVRLK